MTSQTQRPHVVAIGAGQWGTNVIRVLYELGTLAGIAEPNQARRDELADTYPEVPLYKEHYSALKTPADAVAIATPAPTHHKIAQDAILASKDVFVEKPITLALEEAEDLVHLAEDHDRVLMVGHLLLYQPAIEHLKALLDEGAIGTVHSLHQQRAKLGRVRRVENVLWSFGVHDLAVFLHLLGQTPATVQATGQRVLQDTVEDDVHLHLTFPGGAQAHLHTSWLWPETTRRLVVIGSQGMLVYDEVNDTITRHDRTVDNDLAAHDAGAQIVYEDDGASQPLTRELEHFLTCVETRSGPRSPGSQGVAVVDILEQADTALERDAP